MAWGNNPDEYGQGGGFSLAGGDPHRQWAFWIALTATFVAVPWIWQHTAGWVFQFIYDLHGWETSAFIAYYGWGVVLAGLTFTSVRIAAVFILTRLAFYLDEIGAIGSFAF